MEAQYSKDKNANNSPAAVSINNPVNTVQQQASISKEVSQTNAVQLRIQKSAQMVAQKRQIEMMNGVASASETAQLADMDEEELLQGKFQSADQPVSQLQEKPNKTGLPDNLKSGVESLSGLSMDDVKVHYNSEKPAQLNALAYAQGTDIHVGPGQSQHLPHEAWHVAQQKQGRVQPTIETNGVAVNDDTSLEKEADVMGAKAMQMKPIEEEDIG